MTKVHVVVDALQAARLNAAADAIGRSISAVVRDAVIAQARRDGLVLVASFDQQNHGRRWASGTHGVHLPSSWYAATRATRAGRSFQRYVAEALAAHLVGVDVAPASTPRAQTPAALKPAKSDRHDAGLRTEFFARRDVERRCARSG